MAVTDGIDYQADAEEAHEELTRVALGIAQILTDMGSSNASRASDTVEATQAALSLLGDRLYDAAWEAREAERKRQQQTGATEPTTEG